MAEDRGGYAEWRWQTLEDLRRRGTTFRYHGWDRICICSHCSKVSRSAQRSEKLRSEASRKHQEHPAGNLHHVLKRLPGPGSRRQKSHLPMRQKLIRASKCAILARKPIWKVHRTGPRPDEGWRVLKNG